MKSLTLIRHAKSSWKLPVGDRYRPLNQRGYRQAGEVAARVARQLTTSDPVDQADSQLRRPDRILCSPATRAFTTCGIFCDACNIEWSRVEICAEIYLASVQGMLKGICTQFESCDHLWVFGHNPQLESLAEYLLARPVPPLATCSYVAMLFDEAADSALTRGSARLGALFCRERELLS